MLGAEAAKHQIPAHEAGKEPLGPHLKQHIPLQHLRAAQTLLTASQKTSCTTKAFTHLLSFFSPSGRLMTLTDPNPKPSFLV